MKPHDKLKQTRRHEIIHDTKVQDGSSTEEYSSAPASYLDESSEPNIQSLSKAVRTPQEISPATIIHLQRLYGNQVVQRLLKNQSTNKNKLKQPKSPVQAKIQRVYEPETYEKAIKRHRKNREYLTKIIFGGLKLKDSKEEGDIRFYNTCEWIINQTDQSKIRIYALTLTHNWKKRKDGNNKAFFGLDVSNPEVGTVFPQSNDEGLYDEGEFVEGKNIFGKGFEAKLEFNGKDEFKNIFPLDDGEGFHYDEGIAIVDPCDYGPEIIRKRLIHEMQHYADLHSKNEKFVSGTPAEKNLERYKTEVRAYSYESDKIDFLRKKFGNAPLTGDKVNEFINDLDLPKITDVEKYKWNPAQLSLFCSLYESYGYVKENWDKESSDADLSNRVFQKGVTNYKQAESINPLNSRKNHEKNLENLGKKSSADEKENLPHDFPIVEEKSNQNNELNMELINQFLAHAKTLKEIYFYEFSRFTKKAIQIIEKLTPEEASYIGNTQIWAEITNNADSSPFRDEVGIMITLYNNLERKSKE